MESPQSSADLIAGSTVGRRHWVAAAALLLAAFAFSPAWSQPQAVETMRHRVVQVRAWEGGVGFVVGERDGRLWIVTANHVVRSEDEENEGELAPEISVRFFDHPDRSFKAIPPPGAYLGKPTDLAVLTVDVPPEVASLPPACAPKLDDYRLPVWFIGVGVTWKESHQGDILTPRPKPDQLLAVHIDSVTQGTSGAPLVAAQGVVGMLLGNSPRAISEADALAIGFIRDRVLEWGFEWSLGDCEAAAGPQRVSTRFPLLGQPAPGAWRNEEAGRLFLEGREELESRDFFCSFPPSFGLMWPPRSLAEMMRLTPTGEILHDLSVVGSLERSLALEDNRWVRFYRGLALARIRAFQPALDDVRSAYEGFKDAGEYAHAEVVGKALERVERWRTEPVRRPGDAPVPAECRTETPATVCQLLTRIAPSDQAALEPRRLVADVRRLLGGEAPAALGFVAPAVKAQLDCAFAFAEDVENVEVAIAVFEFLLGQARARGLDLLTNDYLPAFARALLRHGRTAEAESALRDGWGSLDERQRVALLVELAFDPKVLPASYDAMLALGGIDDELRARLRSLRDVASELRALLEKLSAAIVDAADREGATWYLDAVRYLEEGTAWTSEEFVAHLPAVDERAGAIGSLLAAALHDLGIGADLLALGANELLSELDAIVRHPAAEAELRSIRERAVASRKVLLEALAAADNAALTSAGAAGLVAGLWTFTALDLQLTGEVDDDQKLMAFALDPRAAFRAQTVRGYRHAAHLLSAMVQGVFADSLAASMMSTIAREMGMGSFDGVVEVFERFDRCADGAGAPERLACLGGVIRKLLVALEDTEFVDMVAAPILMAHGDAREEVLDAVNRGDTRDPDLVYAERFFAGLAERTSTTAVAKQPIAQQLALVALGAILESLARELKLELAPIVVDTDALEEEAKELLAAVRLLGLSVQERPESRAVDRAAQHARVRLETSKQALARILILANPLTYRGLSPEEIAALLARVRRSGMDQEVMRLALDVALAVGSEPGAAALEYDQLKVLAGHFDDEQFGTLAVLWPLSGDLARFSTAVEPLTVRESWDECEGEDGLSVGLVQEGLTQKSHLLAMLLCKCCISPTWTVPRLLPAAAAEGRWPEVGALLRDLERRALQSSGRSWWGALGTALLDLFAGEPKMPDDLADSALEVLRRPNVQMYFSDAERLAFAATVVELSNRDPLLSSLPRREELLDSVRTAGELATTDLSWDGELTLQSSIEYSDRLGKAVERLADPLLEWEWTRQTATIRGIAAQLVMLGDEAAVGGQTARDFVKWLKDQSAEGDKRASTHLGRIFGDLDGPRAAEAAALLRRAAEAGDREAMIHVGMLYARGHGLAAEPTLAQRWLEKAAERGSTEAMIRLGEVFLRGWGVPPNDTRARRWFLAAAEAGNPEGMFQLALLDLLANGDDARVTGLAWLGRAAKAGHAAAIEAQSALERR